MRIVISNFLNINQLFLRLHLCLLKKIVEEVTAAVQLINSIIFIKIASLEKEEEIIATTRRPNISLNSSDYSLWGDYGN